MTTKIGDHASDLRRYLVVLSELCLNGARPGVELDDEVDAPDSSRYAVRAEVVARYRRGETSREVAKGCRIAKSTVLKILRSEGVDIRPWGLRY